MKNFDLDLMILEQLSEQISDLINNNSFEDIKKIDKQRKLIIKNFNNKIPISNHIKSQFSMLIKKNEQLISNTQNKFRNLQKDKNNFDKRLKSYAKNM